VKSTNYEAPRYAAFSTLPSLYPSLVQFQAHYFSENLVAREIELGTSGSVARNFDH
jgi:hypothetical protein